MIERLIEMQQVGPRNTDVSFSQKASFLSPDEFGIGKSNGNPIGLAELVRTQSSDKIAMDQKFRPPKGRGGGYQADDSTPKGLQNDARIVDHQCLAAIYCHATRCHCTPSSILAWRKEA